MAKKVKKKLTLKELKKMQACREAIEQFQEIFGKKAKIKDIVQKLHNSKPLDSYSGYYKSWEKWLLVQTPELTRALLDAGADIHVMDDDALLWVTKGGSTRRRTETAEILRQAMEEK